MHKIRSANDQGRRLGVGRRVFGYQHAELDNELLNFVNVALTHSISSSVDVIIDGKSECPEADAECAMFYSINTAQEGLDGMNLGHSLIKDSVAALQLSMPHISTFCTLSPITSLLRNSVDK